MGVCKIGFACEVTAPLNDERADVFIIDKVLSVVNVIKNPR
jgi:hypothetical protein